MDENIFMMMDNEGNPVKCWALYTFESEETGKTYVFYTDQGRNEDGSVKVYACAMDEEKRALPVETAREWEILNEALEKVNESGYFG